MTGNEVMPGHELFHSNFFPLMCVQAVSTQKDERRETRGRVVWATFETGDGNGMYSLTVPI